jgi:Calx-beta domain/FG-GAP-like repeat/FG-GAP repeat
MRLLSWLDGLQPTSQRRRSKRRRGPRPQPPPRRLSVEALDDRILPGFLGPVNYAAGSNPYAIVAADFNHDTIPDLAIANYSSNTVSVLLGNGNGTFQPALDSATGFLPLSLAVGDFDGDTNLDIVTANNYDVSVLLGNGNGTFQPPSSIGIGSNPASVAVGDFNHDGTLDLGVTSNVYVFDGFGWYGNYYHYDGYANVLIGNGDGTFSAAGSQILGSGPEFAILKWSAAAVDLNGDGIDDLAVTNDAFGTVGVLINDGSGILGSPIDYFAGYYAQSVAADDLDGDGDIDLVTANYYYGSASVLLNNGSGAFGSAQTYPTGSGASISIALADFNNDTHPDIATANTYTNDVSVLLGRGDGTFSPALHSAAGSYTYGVAAGDFNGDGWADVAAANYYGGNASVLLNDHTWPPADAPSVSISDVTVTEGNSGTLNVTFTISLSAAYSQAIMVHYATADGTATAGGDYTAVSTDVTFLPTETTKTITVAIVGDRLAEQNENFFVNLTTGGAFIADGQGVGTILDNEPRISINSVQKVEGNAKGGTLFVFTVTLSVAYDETVTVNFATADGSARVSDHDYQAKSGMLTFLPNETSKTISILVYGDKKNEPNEWFAVNLSGESSNALLVDATGIGTILNDDRRGRH